MSYKIERVCAWCDREISENGEPGRLVGGYKEDPVVKFDCCRDCRSIIEGDIRKWKFAKRVDQILDKVYLRIQTYNL